MCNKTILRNGGVVESVPSRCKAQEMCNKVVDNYAHALKSVPDQYKMWIKANNTHHSTIKYVPDWYNTE